MAAQFIDAPQGWVHGETISGTPSGGAATSITAVVERGEIQTMGPSGVLRNEYSVAIFVTRAEWPTLTLGVDTFTLKKRITDSSTTTMRAAKLLDDAQDGAGWHVELK